MKSQEFPRAIDAPAWPKRFSGTPDPDCRDGTPPARNYPQLRLITLWANEVRSPSVARREGEGIALHKSWTAADRRRLGFVP